MNLRITLTFLLMAFVLVGMNAQVIWGGPGDPNGEFAGGLNDWTTMGLSSHVPDSASNAVWFHTPDGLSNGSLFGDTPIASESVGNGAAIFDSDFLDNGGNIEFDDAGNVLASSVGGGPAPCFEPGGFSGAGHSGVLTSPTIDCSGESSVLLRFFSYFRSFNGQMFVDVSNDDGETFTAVEVNTNESLGSTPDNIVTLNISDIAANSPTVKIQFRWTGSYYFWMVDDVSLVSLPPFDLTLLDNESSPFYTPHSAVQPNCALENDPFFFSANFSNSGADTVTNFTYKVEIYNNDVEELVYSDSIVLAEFAPGISDSTVAIEEFWDPIGLEEGIYRIEHSVYSPDIDVDFNPSDNDAVQFFEASATTFSKELGGNGAFGTWNDGGFYAVGAFYQFGPNCEENFTVASIDYAVGQVGADEEPLVGRPVQFWLWKLTVPFSDFDATTNYEEDILSVSHPSMEFVGFSIDAIDEDDASADIIVSDEAFLDVDAEPVTPIFEPGETYALFAHWGTEGTSPLHLYTRDFNTTTDLFYSGGWFGGFTGTKSAPILRLQLQLVSSVDDQPLADEAFKVYPNPATDLVNLELNLETASNATVTIADITGRVIKYQNLSSVQNEMISINVANYVSGTYLARVATEQGTKTIKFVIE